MPSHHPSLTIVLPAYNEARRIGPALDELLGYLRRTGPAREGGRAPDELGPWDVLIVDDGSDDECGSNTHPALEVLAFLLDMHIPQRLVESDFKWRNLLSTVQKSHHKSNDIPKILAAVNVYRGMAEVVAVREDVLKKLLSMLKTNPYPKVRLSVAETLYVETRDEVLKGRDWTKPTSVNVEVAKQLEGRWVGG